MKYMRQRAADPDICIICAGPLEKRDRSFKLYCGQRCQKIGWRRGVNTEELTAIRVNAVRTAHGHPMHAKEGKEGDP
ncbi:MAG: hypothetical protein GXX95_03960 [Methanomassiliicoccus sp.]|nr:hypothetical protein [Methanomassiliicoccus sp.]